jgi:lysophospholipase L1-like esterase
MTWRCFVALGDSFTAGTGDPVSDVPSLTWDDWLAQAIREQQGALEYHNLARHGLRTAQIREEQLGRSLEYRPDLASVIAGANDVMGFGWDPARFRADYDAMIAVLGDAGATVITGTMAKFAALVADNGGRGHRRLRERVEAANTIIREVSGARGTVFVDFWALSQQLDRAFWSADDIHPNMRGYQLVAREIAAALTARSGVPLRIGA